MTLLNVSGNRVVRLLFCDWSDSLHWQQLQNLRRITVLRVQNRLR